MYAMECVHTLYMHTTSGVIGLSNNVRADAFRLQEVKREALG